MPTTSAVPALIPLSLLEAIRKRMDIVGVFSVAFVSAFGGGTVRDVLLDRRPLFWIQNQEYVWLVIALVLFTVFKQFERTGAQSGMVGYSDFLEEVRNKRIKSVQLQEGPGGSTEIRAKRTDDTDVRTTATCA